MDAIASLSKKPRTKIIWYKSRETYAKKEVDISDLAHQILGRKEEELDAMMKSYHKFKEAHSRFGSAMYPKPVKLGKKRSLPEDLICFGIKGSRLSHKDYQASAKSLGPLAAMKKIQFLQGKFQTPKKKKKGDHATRTLSSAEEAGIKTKLGRAVGTLKSMFINPWSANLVVVARKHDHGKPTTSRVTIDFRGLNSITCRDRYPIPHLGDCLRSLDKASFMSIIDLSNSFYQVPIQLEDRDKTAFITRKGQFRLTRSVLSFDGYGASWPNMLSGLY